VVKKNKILFATGMRRLEALSRLFVGESQDGRFQPVPSTSRVKEGIGEI
jgi:hypothetical protein